jgi:hypothetical protein
MSLERQVADRLRVRMLPRQASTASLGAWRPAGDTETSAT